MTSKYKKNNIWELIAPQEEITMHPYSVTTNPFQIL